MALGIFTVYVKDIFTLSFAIIGLFSVIFKISAWFSNSLNWTFSKFKARFFIVVFPKFFSLAKYNSFLKSLINLFDKGVFRSLKLLGQLCRKIFFKIESEVLIKTISCFINNSLLTEFSLASIAIVLFCAWKNTHPKKKEE